MAVTRHTLTGNIHDLVNGVTGVDITKVRARVDTNVPAGTPLVDSVGGDVLLGSYPIVVAADGSFTVTNMVGTDSTGLNWLGLLYQVVISYTDLATRQRASVASGWFTLIADVNLASVTPVASAAPSPAAGFARRVNGVPASDAGDLPLAIGQLLQVSIDDPQYDIDGVLIPGTGPQAGQALVWEPLINEWVNGAPVATPPVDMIQGRIVARGDAKPTGLPANYLIVDANDPAVPVQRRVNTVAASGAAVTLPDPRDYQVHDITLTANTVALTFPTPVPGEVIEVMLRQDATGSRAVTWPATVQNSGGVSMDALQTTATRKDVFTFKVYGGSSWLCTGHVWYSGTPQPQATPTVLTTYPSATTGTGGAGATNLTSSALPAGLGTTDRALMVISASGAVVTMATPPSGWTLKSGPDRSGGGTSFLYEKNLTAGDSSTTVNSGTLSATVRITMGITIIRGVDQAHASVVALAADTTADSALDLPAVTPDVGNSMLVALAGSRFAINSGTAPSITTASPWTERLDVNEGRTDGTSLNYGVWSATLGLTGQANTAQGGWSAAGAYVSSSASETAYVVAIAPPVS